MRPCPTGERPGSLIAKGNTMKRMVSAAILSEGLVGS
jgi:hypothetical protein